MVRFLVRHLFVGCCLGCVLISRVVAAPQETVPTGQQLAEDVQQFFSQAGLVMVGISGEIADWIRQRYDRLPDDKKAKVRDFIQSLKQQYRLFREEASESGKGVLDSVRVFAKQMLEKFRKLQDELRAKPDADAQPLPPGVVI